MQEALAQARAELGEEAVVLNSKHVKAGGVLGLRGGTRVELMAAIDDLAPEPSRVAVIEAERRQPVAVAPMAAKAYAGSSGGGVSVAEPDVEIKQIQSDLRDLGAVVQRLLSSQPQIPVLKQPLLMRLGVDEDIARGVLADLLPIDNPLEMAAALAGKIQGFVAPPALEGRQVIAVVGPTGVGKTTTLAKLAARFALEQGKKVALVTADTFRIGAVEQLRTYARIMGVPLEIALSPEEVAAGVEKHSDKDVVLIDTVGRSQRSDDHLAELKSFVEAAKPTDTYLCVAASLGSAVQREVVEKFAVLSPSRLVITKLDESWDRGSLVNLPLRTSLGIACLTAGQNVPQDIDFADAGLVARLVAGVAQ
jgi:flagellar biosynthesis protein FlhF